MANIDDVKTIIQNRTSVIISDPGPVAGFEDILITDLHHEINAAVRDYSVDEPRVIMLDKVPGDLTDVNGVKMFKLDDWDFDTADPVDVSIEHPVDLARSRFLRRGEDLDFEIVERPTGGGGEIEAWIKFFSPPAGTPPNDAWRLKYATRYKDVAEDATLSELTKRAVLMVGLLSGVYVARFFSGKFGKTNDAQISADVVDYRSRAAEWREIANTLWEEYQNRLERPSKIKRPGTDVAVVDLDLSLGRGNRYGRNFLVHRKRFR